MRRVLTGSVQDGQDMSTVVLESIATREFG